MTAPACDVAVIGGGVLGAFHAYAAWRRGLSVVLIERNSTPRDASVRNFGLIIPSAMPPGAWRRRGVASRATYLELAAAVGFTVQQGGVQYVAATAREAQLLEEAADASAASDCPGVLLARDPSRRLNPHLADDFCRASLHFPHDLRLDPRDLFPRLLAWLASQGVDYRPGTVATRIEPMATGANIWLSTGQRLHARRVFVCGGADLRTLYPARLQDAGLTYCKLQMLRASSSAGAMPVCVAAPLCLRRYAAFQACPSWAALAAEPLPAELEQRGIHVWLAPDGAGNLVIGDSHAYSPTEPDDLLDAATEEAIVAYAARLLRDPPGRIVQRWCGVYMQPPDGEFFHDVVDGVAHLVTGIGGKGMTTGPALAEELVAAALG